MPTDYSLSLPRIMHEKGYTQKTLSEKAGISQSTLSAIINGASPKPATLKALLDALGISQQQLFEKTTQEVSVCLRCGSKAITEWYNHGNGHYRLKCNYCEADSGEQPTKAKAVAIFESFKTTAERRASANVCVLSLAELLDSSCADEEDCRPVWFENRGLFIVPAIIRYGGAERELELVKVLWYGTMGAKSYMLSTYNEAWRCWNQKPTAERSDATPWKS